MGKRPYSKRLCRILNIPRAGFIPIPKNSLKPYMGKRPYNKSLCKNHRPTATLPYHTTTNPQLNPMQLRPIASDDWSRTTSVRDFASPSPPPSPKPPYQPQAGLIGTRNIKRYEDVGLGCSENSTWPTWTLGNKKDYINQDFISFQIYSRNMPLAYRVPTLIW